jgi:hypothetical protein
MASARSKQPARKRVAFQHVIEPQGSFAFTVWWLEVRRLETLSKGRGYEV